MLEYIFFNKEPFQLFANFLELQKIDSKITNKEESIEVGIPEDTNDDILDEIDYKYDQLMELDQKISEDQEDEIAGNFSGVSLSFKLKNGITSNANIDPQIIAKILNVITPEELNTLINAIVVAVENPDERSICQQLRDEKS
jgi:hypothetical protein